ncbi:MAG: hypothetical protein AB7U63_13825 [Porticoccaceae bacterium]|jgi:hypothetical protein
MQPDLNSQLLVAINTLKKVVQPAVAIDNKPAQEQLMLTIKTLEASRERLRHRRRYIRQQLILTINMAKTILALLTQHQPELKQQLAKNLAEAIASYNDIDADCETLMIWGSVLTENLSQLVTAYKGTPAYDAIAKVLIVDSEPLIALGRRWCSDNGLETEHSL